MTFCNVELLLALTAPPGPSRLYFFILAQVESLGIEPRLVQKWRAKRDVRGDVKSKAPFSRAFFIVAVLRAMCASFAHWLYVSDGRAANRLRSFFALACLVAFVAFVYLLSSAV